MNKKCLQCGLINYRTARICIRCGSGLNESENISPKRAFHKSALVKRAAVCLAVLLFALGGFYTSLVFSADPLRRDENAVVDEAIKVLSKKGFSREAFLLRNLVVYRANDNWLNASVVKENAYAATNFPFEIVTLYPDFFAYSTDEVERAAILLHEAKHLEGKDEREAYEFVWKNRKKLGWTSDDYSDSVIWRGTRKQTRDYVPHLFVCDVNDFDDCTE